MSTGRPLCTFCLRTGHRASSCMHRPSILPAPTQCACFPGTCRGGQIVNGKTTTGLACKAQIPAARHA